MAASFSRRPALVLALALLMLALLARPARALGAVEGEIAAKGGIATAGDVGPETPLGPGGGARGGVSIHGFYVGLDALYYQGSPSGLCALQGGVETGYGFRPGGGPVTVRPQVGFGSLATTGGSTDGGPDSRIGAGFFVYVEPAVTVLVALPAQIFVGADLGVLMVPGALYDGRGGWTTLAALAAHAQVGVRF